MPRKSRKTQKIVKDNMTRLTNNIMKHGKKAKAENIVNNALNIVVTKLPESYELPEALQGIENVQDNVDLKKAIVDDVVERVRPLLMVKSQRIGGANQQIPRDVPVGEGISIAIRWIVEAARKRSVGAMAKKLADEMLDALKNVGGALRKKEEAFKMAQANRVFSNNR